MVLMFANVVTIGTTSGSIKFIIANIVSTWITWTQENTMAINEVTKSALTYKIENARDQFDHLMDMINCTV